MATTAPPLQGLRRTLRRRFGFHSLREGQEEVIRFVLAGKDTLAIMPTGAGKSLCYQLPGLQMPGITVVVSPLLSLMKDQADKLAERGVDAAQVNSMLTTREESEVLEEIRKEQREFVFCTPERLAQPEFLATLRQAKIDLLVVDEAHCISEWGHDFRPAYLIIKDGIAALGNPPVLALTATATEQVIEDIVRRLGREDMEIIDTGILRDNLRFEVVPCSAEADKREHLARLLRETDGTGIVYVATVRGCEEVTSHLAGLGFEVARYHGRMGSAERRRHQDRFMAGELKALIATNAFGMGIDKPDIRFVAHYHLPGSLESYYQEAGRAGRDGEPARCVLLHLPEDRNTQLFFIHGGYPKPEHFLSVARALGRARDGEGVALTTLHDKSGVAQTKLRVILASLREMGLVEETERGVFVRTGEVGGPQVEEAARLYQAKIEADRERLRRMVAYAQTALCRWKALLAYFGEEVEWERCGHCDNCSRPIATLPEVKPPAPDPHLRAPEVRPLPPLLGGKDVADIQPGDMVTLSIYGRGEVREVTADRLVVAFAGGEVREFRKP
jgi:ATP-dependent DNA helicase RecQ